MKATDERAGVSECESASTSPQCFSPMSQTSMSPVMRRMMENASCPYCRDMGYDAMYGLFLDGACGVCGGWYTMGHRMPPRAFPAPTNDPDAMGVVRVGRGYVASVGRVRVASACPLRALADACEWSRLFG